jgi:hypothetical protein
MGWQAWLKVIGQNRQTILTLAKDSLNAARKARREKQYKKTERVASGQTSIERPFDPR